MEHLIEEIEEVVNLASFRSGSFWHFQTCYNFFVIKMVKHFL